MSINQFPELQVDPQSSLPLYAQIKQQITWYIASGRLKAGDQLPPIRALSATLHIHMHTVRYAYQLLEQEKLVEVRRGGGTTVLSCDPTLFTHRRQTLPSHTIGVLIPDLANFYMPFLRGIESIAQKLPALIMVANTHDNPENAQMIVNQLVTRGVDGIIIVSNEAIRNADLNVPIVYADLANAPDNVITVQLDSFGALMLTTEHMLWHGYRKILYLTAPLAWENVNRCYQGFCEAIKKSSQQVDSDLVELPGFDADMANQAVSEYLHNEKPDCVIACADILALGAMRAIKARGYQIPGDVAVIGYNNIDLAALVEPPLSTASLPIYEMGERTMKNLLMLLGGKEIDQKKITLPSQLVLRQSCGCKNK